MRILEFIVKSLIVWQLTIIVLRIPIFTGIITETDRLDLVIVIAALLAGLVLTWFAVVRRRLTARYFVFYLVVTFTYLLAACWLFYPTYYAWNKYGFWAAGAAFLLPFFSHLWTLWMNIRQGMWGYAIAFVVYAILQMVCLWCRVAQGTTTDTHNNITVRSGDGILNSRPQ